MKTTKPIEYHAAPYGLIATIPAGTKVEKATNLEGEGLFWAQNWRGMTDQQKSWARNYGFLLTIGEIEGK